VNIRPPTSSVHAGRSRKRPERARYDVGPLRSAGLTQGSTVARNSKGLLFDGTSPASTLFVRDLRRMNPWWSDGVGPVLPPTRRHLVDQIHRRLQDNLAPITVVRGPRQIGKTTAQLQVIDDLLHKGVAKQRIMRVQFDDIPEIDSFAEPIVQVVQWFEEHVLGRTLNEAAHAGERAYLFFDEVQNLRDWSPQLKSLVDHSTTSVVVTGSSALRIELGRDSLAGRISTIEAGVLTLTEIGAIQGVDLGKPFLADNGLDPLTSTEFWRELSEHGRRIAPSRDEVFRSFAERGGYPLVHRDASIEWPKLADQLNENVVKRVILHDLRVGDRGRKRDPVLLEAVFRMCCRYVGQAPDTATFVREARETAGGNVGEQKVRHYIQFLHDTLLIRLIEPLEIRLKRRRSAAKICLADHGLRRSWLHETVPLVPEDLARAPHLGTIAGHIVESIVGAALKSITHLNVQYSPARKGEPEVDFVLTFGTKRIPIEVKYQRRIDPVRDAENLRSFVDRRENEAPFALLITQTDGVEMLDPRVVTISLPSFLLLR